MMMDSELVSLDTDYSNLQTYQIRDIVILRFIVLSILGFLGLLVIFLIGFSRWKYALTNFGPAVIWRWISPTLWIGIGFGLLGIVALVLLLRVGRQEIQISPESFTWRKGRKLQVYPWKAIQGVYVTSVSYGILDFAWARKTEIVLEMEEGKHLSINQTFENIEKLLENIKRHVYPIMFERLKNNFQQGEPLSFGPLLLTSQGVLNGRKPLRWQDIGKISLEQGSLRFQPVEGSEGPKFTIPVHKIPNFELCLQLLHHFGSQP
jgi:hypothetical protein